MSDLNDFVQDFLAECREGLDLLDTEMVELERNPDDSARLDRVFRTLHTIKGNCGFLEFERLGALAHAGETLLSRLRERQLTFSREIADQLLQLIDAVRVFVKEIAASGHEGTNDFALLRDSLLKLANSSTANGNVDSQSRTAKAAASSQTQADVVKNDVVSETTDAARISKPIVGKSVPDNPSDIETRQQKDDEKSRVVRKGEEVALVPPPTQISPEKLAVSQQPAPTAPKESVEPPKPVRSTDSSVGSSELLASSIRVQVGLLERLMNLIGELVLTRNQLLQRAVLLSDPATSMITQRLNSITTDLQEEFMRTRMVRIGVIWQRFPRVVRDTARQCGKEVQLVTEGDSTELDRTLVEAISDPLTHLIRNAIDHGIERPHDRKAKGKSTQGTLTLRAYHEGGQVHIEISDDGTGIDVDKVRRKAVQVGLFSFEESIAMNESEVRNSIFLPGFSTAESISNLSGRGVGMDVVKTRIEQAGGTVQIESVVGQGTTVRLTLPLTMAIIPALIVRSAGCQYAIPQVSLNELMRLTADEARQRIDVVQGSPMLRLRGRLLPLLDLREMLRAGTANSPEDETCILVLRTANRTFGLIVDAVTNNEEIVVRPLVPMLQGLPIYAGSTLLGNGTLALILDVLGLARHSGIFERAATISDHERSNSTESMQVNLSSGLLLCETRDGRRVAFSVSKIRRLEEFSVARLERAGHQLVVQYRDDVLPVLDVATLLFTDSTATIDSEPESWPVVICDSTSGDVACRVARVLDIATAPQKILPSQAAGIAGSAIIDQRMTDLLDVERLFALSLSTQSPQAVLHLDETLPPV